jgi:hypothetical protein
MPSKLMAIRNEVCYAARLLALRSVQEIVGITRAVMGK